MATTGELFPTSIMMSQAAVGDLSLSAHSAITANDGAPAYITAATYDLSVFSMRLKAKGFVMPAGVSAGATIDGIIMRIEGWGSTSIFMSANILSTTGAIQGTGKAGTSGAFSATTAVYSLGHASDKWGATLSGNLVLNSQFGVGLRFTALGANKDFWVDYITLEIVYDTPATVPQITFVEC